MMRIETDRIDAFMAHVAALLNTDFKSETFERCIVLHAISLELTIIIYLPGAGARLRNTGNRTIHIDYDQVIHDADKLSARLASLFGSGQVIYARKTVVARVDKCVTLSFLLEHHLQSAIPGKYRYGLYHEGELVSLAVFSGGRNMRDQRDGYRSFELIRFCHKSGYRIVGGLSKLLKAFIHDFNPDDIMTYVDRDWSQDSNLSTLGFKEVGSLPAQCYRVVNGLREMGAKNEQNAIPLNSTSDGYFIYNSGSTKLVLSL
ncbi:hypothetical protein [Sphingobacterium deserti]|uniref:Uncharacterized protein n=1 Tax=Sphingobacterium deserti TaxID=1229276 RepID=A0A0B8T939_9SPHI|nr:hypothetical protein [Sphingobacterium deserti]KGE14510.1 hypothetical protein DI53_1539 [Sphingobacterium deserti]